MKNNNEDNDNADGDVKMDNESEEEEDYGDVNEEMEESKQVIKEKANIS